MLIAIEGLDGMGKTTLARDLKAHLEKEGKEVVLTALAGACTRASLKLIRVAKMDESISDDCRQAVFFAAAIEIVNKVIKPALAERKIVITDRYTASNYAYSQASKSDEVFLAFIHEYMLSHFPKPTLHVFITGSVETMRERLKGKKADAIEKNSDEYFDDVKFNFSRWVDSYKQQEFETGEDGPFVQFTSDWETASMVDSICKWINYNKEKEKVNA